MFLALTQQDYAVQDDGGECKPYRRLVLVPYSCIELISELQNDDADSDHVMMYGFGARTIVELKTEIIYVVEQIQQVYELSK